MNHKHRPSLISFLFSNKPVNCKKCGKPIIRSISYGKSLMIIRFVVLFILFFFCASGQSIFKIDFPWIIACTVGIGILIVFFEYLITPFDLVDNESGRQGGRQGDGSLSSENK